MFILLTKLDKTEISINFEFVSSIQQKCEPSGTNSVVSIHRHGLGHYGDIRDHEVEVMETVQTIHKSMIQMGEAL